MMFIYKTATFPPVWTTIPKIWAIFIHQTSTEHALCSTAMLLAQAEGIDPVLFMKGLKTATLGYRNIKGGKRLVFETQN